MPRARKSCLTAAGKMKKTFWKLELAHQAIADINERQPGKVNLEPYWCDVHNGFHLGSSQIQRREYVG